MARENISTGFSLGVPAPNSFLHPDSEDLLGVAIRAGAMSGEFYTSFSSGSTEDLQRSRSFVYFVDILRRLTEGHLSWLQKSIETARKRRLHKSERLDRTNAMGSPG